MGVTYYPRTPEQMDEVQERNLRDAIGDELYDWLEQQTKSPSEEGREGQG